MGKVKENLNAGIDIDKPRPDGLTALKVAISGHEEEVVKYLIKKGANVNLETAGSYPPLFYLCHSYSVSSFKPSKLRIAKLLVNAGAKINHVSGGQSLIESCIKDETNEEIISYFKSKLDK